ncbi:type III pantothenate kinase [Bradyrhizobium macuxiense]|uniref:Type III pantothenate kinase n=1 Tax=Bradyrhizobium macuxiense TaxID=1755647 RepID=A0A120FJ49_9BRAD|nr:type III pantothenate kinase [Bradyrhizobium macuxiense]KWV48544.1 type III pantothenate kinase [Bradyrhizobium macuxiense]
MLLAIDQGNTNSVFAVHDGEQWVAQWRSATAPSRTADEYAAWLSQLMAMHRMDIRLLDACVIASVVPQSIFNLRNLSRRYLGVEPLIVGENTQLGIQVRTLKPAEVGADRLVNALGALAVYPAPLIVVDSGTAIKLDVIGRDGAFEGGAIAPGVHLSMEALHDAAAKLPRVALQRPQRVIGNDTVSALQSGIFWGHVALIEGMIARIKAERNEAMTVVATGGAASLFHDASAAIDHFDPDLTIRGLLEIYRRNTTTGREGTR